jgi:hypothetical protein
MLMKRLLAVVGISLSIFGWTVPAIAQSTRTVSLSEARGEPEIVTLELSEGHGTTLNFRPVGETVRRAWLDDLSKVTLSFDDANCNGQGNGCAATVIHLRRINPLDFPDLPKTETTLLTVVTDWGVYMFRLTFPAGDAGTYLVEIQPDPVRPRRTIAPQLGNASVAEIERGLNVAQDQNLIQENSSLWERVQQVTAAVREGKTIEEAVAEVGVSTELVTRLVEMGQRSPFPAAELSL